MLISRFADTVYQNIRPITVYSLFAAEPRWLFHRGAGHGPVSHRRRRLPVSHAQEPVRGRWVHVKFAINHNGVRLVFATTGKLYQMSFYARPHILYSR